MIDEKEKIETLKKKPLDQLDLQSWRTILKEETKVYSFGECYIAKRFDSINYQFVCKDTAKEILTDNLYALLRFKYKKMSASLDDKKIDEIVKSITTNIKTSLKKITFDEREDGLYVKKIPASCIAFKNGVFDFKANTWLFKYKVSEIKELNLKLYEYEDYCLLWYLNFDFEPIDRISSLDEVYDYFNSNPNECFKLMYNIAHSKENKFDKKRFSHLAQIMGYTILQDFCQQFVMLIGSGGNGKNSLFDGCLTSVLRPMATSNSLDALENDKFISGALENRYQNIFLESDAKTYKTSTMLKQFTGSSIQTIESKGENKRTGYINCKFVFSANDQDKIKFEDTTDGFKRRINMFEIYFRYDEKKLFLKRGDYFDTTFSDDLREIKNNIINNYCFCYFAMLGIKEATNNFSKTFKFTENDWNQNYAEIDVTLKEAVKQITTNHLIAYLNKCDVAVANNLFYDENKNRLSKFKNINRLLSNEEEFTDFFVNNDVYISVTALASICGFENSQTFSSRFKKAFNNCTFDRLYNNKLYVKCNLLSHKVQFI